LTPFASRCASAGCNRDDFFAAAAGVSASFSVSLSNRWTISAKDYTFSDNND
jgi:hypothetical protein